MELIPQRVLDEVVDRLRAALDVQIDRLENFQVTIGPITIPAFTIKLGKQG
jgi:hypothetical protein